MHAFYHYTWTERTDHGSKHHSGFTTELSKRCARRDGSDGMYTVYHAHDDGLLRIKSVQEQLNRVIHLPHENKTVHILFN